MIIRFILTPRILVAQRSKPRVKGSGLLLLVDHVSFYEKLTLPSSYIIV